MNRKDFIQSILAFTSMSTLGSLKALANQLPKQSKRMPVLFTSHGSPMDIPLSREERPFWTSLYELGRKLENEYEVKAALVVSAHWCTNGTYVNVSVNQKQIYDYYGFPQHYYDPKYQAKGAPEVAHEVNKMVPSIKETEDWGLDHGSWPMLMHLFPKADVPVFQMSLNYYVRPTYHYELGQQLKSLRGKGVLIIGSGALIHNLQILGERMKTGDFSPFGWEAEYEAWIKKQIEERIFKNIIHYENSHKLAGLAAPTPDHFVPVLYSLGMTDAKDDIQFFYDDQPGMAAFSELSFIIRG